MLHLLYHSELKNDVLSRNVTQTKCFLKAFYPTNQEIKTLHLQSVATISLHAYFQMLDISRYREQKTAN